jgi:hypothetical protein
MKIGHLEDRRGYERKTHSHDINMLALSSSEVYMDVLH